jgi:DnaJ-domain-containing protein 1
MSSEGGGATSDTDVRPHSFAAPQSRASEQQLRAEIQQLRAEIQRLEQRYAQTVSSMTQERQEALANEAAFTRMARDSSQQLQLKLADAESKIEFLAAFVSTQVPRLANFFFFCSSS